MQDERLHSVIQGHKINITDLVFKIILMIWHEMLGLPPLNNFITINKQ